MDHKDALKEAAMTVAVRHEEYGEARFCFNRIANLASIMLGRHITEYDVAIIMVAVKMGRLEESRHKKDTYIDAINYLAFATEFADLGE